MLELRSPSVSSLKKVFDKPTCHPTREIRTVPSKKKLRSLRPTRCCCLKFQPGSARRGINDGSTFLSIAVIVPSDIPLKRRASGRRSAPRRRSLIGRHGELSVRRSRKSLNETSKQQGTHLSFAHLCPFFFLFFRHEDARAGKRARARANRIY